MSLRDRIHAATAARDGDGRAIFARFGTLGNPFPPSTQNTNNPHRRTSADDAIEERIESFIRDHKTHVVVIEGTQGTGKTNILNHYESEIAEATSDLPGFYVIRYLADPEASFEGTIRRLFQELGAEHIQKLGERLNEGNQEAAELARSVELRTALRRLARKPTAEVAEAFMEWLLGMRLLKIHKLALGVGFRLDTVEAKTAALRDIVMVSSEVGLLNGIFLLLNELEKQDGVLSPTAVVRYLSALRAIIDALPNHLFMMVAVTPDALRRYFVSLPAFRSRLQDRIELAPLEREEEALALAQFYMDKAREAAQAIKGTLSVSVQPILTEREIRESFQILLDRARRSNDSGLRQRRFLHELFQLAEKKIHAA